MIVHKLKCLFAIGLVFAFGGCVPQPEIPLPSETVSFATYTPTLRNEQATDTPRPEDTPTLILASSTPERAPVSGWFPIPKIAHPDTIDASAAQSFKGLRIPPLPAEVVIEFYTGIPYGEVPPETIFYQLYLIRKGDARMLWLGIPFKEATGCCGQETPHRIYDSIPFPPIEADTLLIPFVCTRNHEPDLFLIVVADHPVKGVSANRIHYAWRIDPASASLQPVSIEGVECSPNWW